MKGIRQICKQPSEFQGAFNSVLGLTANGKIPLFLLFTGEKSQATGVSWCPDCVNAEPLINQTFDESSRDFVLLECLVNREHYKGNSEYPYRTLPNIAIKCIPTLIKWSDTDVSQRLNDAQCQDIEKLRKFIDEE